MRLAGLLLMICVVFARAFAQGQETPPNFVLIFTDDQGYGDLGVQGSPNIATPRIDRMAREGIRFTSFYAAPFCGPSRAALMTGCYPPRVSLAFNHSPKAKTGIHPDEITIAEVLKARGYATMMIGKWHLGDAPEFLPTRNGFDSYLGLPFSNDMWPYHPRMPVQPAEDERMRAARARAAYTGFAGEGSFYPPGGGFPYPLPLMRGEDVVELNPDQTKLTGIYTREAVGFIEKNRSTPFFLYLAHAMPHVPLFRSSRFAGVSRRGLYGDVIAELDWSVGEILDTLQRLDLDRRTLVVFTSDNGPWLQYGIDGGSAGPLRNGKGTVWEGGVRVPAIFRWPGQIPANAVTGEVAANLDLLPTFAALAGAGLPRDRVIDGGDLGPLLRGEPNSVSPHEFFYYYNGHTKEEAANLGAIRRGRWKLHVRLESGVVTGTALYDLEGDVGERVDLKAKEPAIASLLERQAQRFNDDLRLAMRPLGRLGGSQ